MPDTHRIETGPFPGRNRILEGAAVAVVFTINVFLWATFRPALMSPDSLTQYEEAATLVFSDWHPPLPSIMLSAVMHVGGDIDTLMFLQCMAFGFGLYLLLREITGHPVPALVSHLLLVALPPLGFYMMTFWKDSWIAVAFLWGGILGLRAGGAPKLAAGIGALASILACFVRDNAAMLLPWSGFLLWKCFGLRARHALVMLIPILLYLPARAGIYSAFHIQPLNKITTLQVYDLAAVCHMRPDVADLIPYSRDVVAPIFAGPGDFFERIFFYGFSFPCDQEKVNRDYRTLIMHAPMAFLGVKLASFSNVLSWEKTTLWHLEGLGNNRLGLEMNGSMEPVRNLIIEYSHVLSQYRWIRILLATHRPWFCLNAGWVLCALILYRKTGKPEYGRQAALLTFPLLYYFSYLATSPAPDFRYMYPSTLALQAVTVAALARLASRRATMRIVSNS